MIEVLNSWGRVWVGPFGLMIAQNTVFLGLIFVLRREFSAQVPVQCAMPS